MPPAEFLVTNADGSVLSGQTTAEGIALTTVGDSTPSIVLPHAPAGVCGPKFAISPDGAYVLATGDGLGCAWRVSDASFVGSVAGEQVTIRDSQFVSVELGALSRDVVRRDFEGREVSRLSLGDTPVLLSPAGDRALTVTDLALVDLDSGEVLDWSMEPSVTYGLPLFSPRGEVVLVGDGVFTTADAVRRFELSAASRVAATGGMGLSLAPDGSLAVSYRTGRATLFDIEAPGVRAVLGPPVLPDPGRSSEGTTDLAISRDGALLVYNIEGSAGYVVRLAPRFGDSQVVFDMRVELNLSVDVSADGRLTAIGGDGRAIHDGQDGHAVWPALPPPPYVPPHQMCLLDRLRLSPKGTWLAGSDYSGGVQIFAVNGEDRWHPLRELTGRCDAAAFTRDERLMATSSAALYRTGASANDWSQVWSSPLPPRPQGGGYASNNVNFSPDEKQLLVSRCGRWSANPTCATTLLNAGTGEVERELTQLTGPDPAFSPDGSWVVAADKLLHLPSGDTQSLGEGTSPTHPAIFTPKGDIIAGSATGALTRYCREE